MWHLKEVEKTMDYVITHINEGIFFIEKEKRRTINGKWKILISSSDPTEMTIGKMEEQLRDPRYILVKIVEEDNDDEAES